jgi:hypothetical protein
MDLASDRCAGGRWLTGQSGAPPDSPVNYSCMPPKTPESSQFAGDQSGASTVSGAPPDSPVCQIVLSLGCFEPSSSLLFFSLILALRQIYYYTKTNVLSLESYLIVDLHFIHHLAYNNT